MKRTPCCLASSPSSFGSMITKRDLSQAKCRSISGNVALPIEPKPIMTMGPVIFAWIDEGGFMGLVSENGCVGKTGASGAATPGGDFDLDLHLGLQESGDDQDRRGRPDFAKHLAANREVGV